eukprot:2942065-Prymnesium_polylepis.1
MTDVVSDGHGCATWQLIATEAYGTLGRRLTILSLIAAQFTLVRSIDRSQLVWHAPARRREAPSRTIPDTLRHLRRAADSECLVYGFRGWGAEQCGRRLDVSRIVRRLLAGADLLLHGSRAQVRLALLERCATRVRLRIHLALHRRSAAPRQLRRLEAFTLAH